MAGKGGGAWKVAYADFVTAMMAFFMVMWLVGQKDDVKEAIATYFQERLGESDPTEGSTDGAPHPPPGRGYGGKPKKDTPSKDPHEKEARRPRLVTLHGGERTAVGAIVVFSEDSLQLNEAARRELDRIVPKLVGMPQKVEVRGHASRRPMKGEGANQDAWQVSYDRCLVVMKYLHEQGIEPNRIRLTQAGVFEPFTIRNETEALARNSRVEVFLLSELAEDLVGIPQERAARFDDGDVAVRDDVSK